MALNNLSGYKMINTLEIQGFKGIKRVNLTGCKRINVLVGPNGTGKTAFLEAIFLASGRSPEILNRTRQLRGRDPQLAGDLGQIYRSLFGDVFWSKDQAKIAISLGGDDGDRSLVIERVGIEKQITPSGETSPKNAGVRFFWDGPEGPFEVTPQFDGSTLSLGASLESMKAHFIPARTNVSEEESARAYSKLRIEGDPIPFESAFLKEYPELQELSVEAPTGKGAIYAKMRYGQQKKLPVADISGGMNHVAGMMVRIAASPRAVVLIDEIENGIFHEQYESIWRSLNGLCLTNGSQLFATTHSLECLQALAAAMKNHADEVRFFRSRLHDGDVVIDQLTGETLFKALKIGDPR